MMYGSSNFRIVVVVMRDSDEFETLETESANPLVNSVWK